MEDDLAMEGNQLNLLTTFWTIGKIDQGFFHEKMANNFQRLHFGSTSQPTDANCGPAIDLAAKS